MLSSVSPGLKSPSPWCSWISTMWRHSSRKRGFSKWPSTLGRGIIWRYLRAYRQSQLIVIFRWRSVRKTACKVHHIFSDYPVNWEITLNKTEVIAERQTKLDEYILRWYYACLCLARGKLEIRRRHDCIFLFCKENTSEGIVLLGTLWLCVVY